ncbi:hypothetical protein XH98_20675 [Bradyrhizobium sp. CCBAU 51745]|nr:hypothetical protein [Bradyrhizobium sp. CCBAU 51745]
MVRGVTIRGGWAARFVLNGVDVRVYDPAPNAVYRLQQLRPAARRAYQRLTQGSLPAEVVENLADAVRNVELVQEFVPEQHVEAEHLTISVLEAKRDDAWWSYYRSYAHIATASERRSRCVNELYSTVFPSSSTSQLRPHCQWSSIATVRIRI